MAMTKMLAGATRELRYRVFDPCMQIVLSMIFVRMGEDVRRNVARRRGTDCLPDVDVILFAGSVSVVCGFVSLLRRCLGPLFRS